MKLCSYETQGRRSYGVQREDGLVVDLRALLGLGAPPTLEDLIEAGLDLLVIGNVAIDLGGTTGPLARGGEEPS